MYRLSIITGFFDIHPPLGKMILAYGSYIIGYRPDPKFVIEKIGTLYPSDVKYVRVRLISAAFSILTVPFTYIIARQFKMSSVASVLPTSAVLFDFLSIIEGRLILMDSQLLFFCQLSLYCALQLWKECDNPHRRTKHLIITGIAAGLALSIKHTALATPALIAVVSFFGLHFIESPLSSRDCVLAGVSGLVTYMIPFYIMFQALWFSGGKYDNFMPLHFRKTLLNNSDYDPKARRKPFLWLFIYLNGRMIGSNASIKKRHTWESKWYQWIVNWRGVLYYVLKSTNEKNESLRAQIYLLGNPVVIYLVLVCVFVFSVLLFLAVRYRQSLQKSTVLRKFKVLKGDGTFLLFGWLCNLLPYLLVTRAAFVYHYLPGLFYGELLSGLLVDLLPKKARVFVVTILVTLMVMALLYWSPWIYSFPLTQKGHERRRWLPRWT